MQEHVDTRRTGFNEGWRFFRGDVPGGESPGFNDDRWLELRLPHDWAIEGPFDSAQNPHTAAVPISGLGRYRKTFLLPLQGDPRRYSVQFDVRLANSHVGR